MYNNNNRKVKKSTSVNLIKTFDNFEDAYTEVIKYVPELKTYCGETPFFNAVVNEMLNSISENIPSSNNENYPNLLSLSIDAHEVGFKTDAGMALGWREAFNKETASIQYRFRVTFISIPSFRKVTIENMKNDGWVEADFNAAKQSRFWNKTEHKQQRNTNRRIVLNENKKDEVVDVPTENGIETSIAAGALITPIEDNSAKDVVVDVSTNVNE